MPEKLYWVSSSSVCDFMYVCIYKIIIYIDFYIYI